MNIRGVSLDAFRDVVREVSDRSYGGNVIVEQEARASGSNGMVGRIRVVSSRGPGARRSSSGRRTPSACWHAYRDVLAAMYDRYPDATARTALATYRGRDGFLDAYPATGYRNVGSEMAPMTMPALCECDGASQAATYEPESVTDMIDAAIDG